MNYLTMRESISHAYQSEMCGRIWWLVSLTLHPEYFTPQLHHTGNRTDRGDKMKILTRYFLARL